MMNQKENVIDALKDIILNFESSTKMVNYAIIFDKRIVLSDNVTDLTLETVENYIEILNIKKVEENFQKGAVEIILFEFEEDSLYYVRCTPKVRIIAVVRKDFRGDIKKKLKNFAEQIKFAVEPLSKPPEDGTNEEKAKIDEMFTTIETIVEEFKVPEFETFKNLVKFAIPFKKK